MSESSIATLLRRATVIFHWAMVTYFALISATFTVLTYLLLTGQQQDQWLTPITSIVAILALSSALEAIDVAVGRRLR